MSASPLKIQLRADSSWKPATLLDGMKATDLLVVENEWRPERSIVMQELLANQIDRHFWPESLHWDWSRKAPQLKLLETSGAGITCDKQWQGVMMTRTASYFARLGRDRGKPLIYIDFLEVAPWNWVIPELGRNGRFRFVGSALFWRAVRQSEEEGFHGRVGLHALPQAESFYEERCGMTRVERDESKENLTYFEFTREQAEAFLAQGDDQ